MGNWLFDNDWLKSFGSGKLDIDGDRMSGGYADRKGDRRYPTDSRVTIAHNRQDSIQFGCTVSTGCDIVSQSLSGLFFAESGNPFT